MKRIRHSRQSGGFSRFEAIVVAVVLAVLIALVLPAFMAARRIACRINCINGVKQIGLSFRVWAEDHRGKCPMQVSVNDGGTMELVGSGVVYPHFRAMSNELGTPMVLVCPEDTEAVKEMRKAMAAYALARGSNGIPIGWFSTNFPVSYFVGVDANTNQRAMFLSGDANLAVGGKPAKPGLLSLWTNSPVKWAKPIRPRHGEGGNIVLVDGHVEQVGNVRLRELLTGSGVATNRLAIP